MSGFRNKVSLSTRLFFSGALISLAVLVIAVAVLSVLQRQNLLRGFDEQLKIYQIGLLAQESVIDEAFDQINDSGNESKIVKLVLADGRFVQPFSGWYWSVVALKQDGPPEKLLSSSLLDEAFPVPERFQQEDPTSSIAFGTVGGPLGQHLRVLRHYAEDLEQGSFRTTFIAGDITELEMSLLELRQRLFIAVGIISLLFAAIGTLQVRFGLRPLAEVSRNISRIRDGQLSEMNQDVPQELKLLTGEIDALITANHQLVERAQRNAGNLAHALKTPLTVIKNESQNLEAKQGEAISQQAEAMQHHIDYHLRRTRAQALAARKRGATNVNKVVGDLFRILSRIHREKPLHFDCTGEIDLVFHGEDHDLAEILGNLLDNAAKWAESEVRVTLEEQMTMKPKQMVLITVEDDGSGLDVEDWNKAMVPGVRLDETVPGSGLGLAIVADLVEAYSGKITFGKAEIGGLKVTVALPARRPEGLRHDKG